MKIRGGYRPAPHIAAKSDLSSALEKRVLATKRVYGDAPAYWPARHNVWHARWRPELI
ncbi:hypothetical protein [Mesorhizobium captivum]|uniref:hypothetical protein n=1 Tax=Mesorhizobium captivum TaxID=3072319 RepID=UPI002A243D5F|nr:hypothetical protein [Mesorhizobium sp. VK4C]